MVSYNSKNEKSMDKLCNENAFFLSNSLITEINCYSLNESYYETQTTY